MHIGVSSDGLPSGMCMWTVLKMPQRWKGDLRTGRTREGWCRRRRKIGGRLIGISPLPLLLLPSASHNIIMDTSAGQSPHPNFLALSLTNLSFIYL
jgi:hypothetical protein